MSWISLSSTTLEYAPSFVERFLLFGFFLYLQNHCSLDKATEPSLVAMVSLTIFFCTHHVACTYLTPQD